MARTIGAENRIGRSRMVICPLEPAWGNWAEWASVIVAGVLGVAVWRLSNASNRTNARVAETQIEADRRAAALQDQERRLILVGISQPVSTAVAITKGFRRDFAAAVDSGAIAHEITQSAERRQRWVTGLDALTLSIREVTLDRLHLVGDPLAAKIMRVIHWPHSLALLIEANRVSTPERALADARLVEVGLRMYVSDLELINGHCLAAMREAGLEIPDPNPPR